MSAGGGAGIQDRIWCPAADWKTEGSSPSPPTKLTLLKERDNFNGKPIIQSAKNILKNERSGSILVKIRLRISMGG